MIEQGPARVEDCLQELQVLLRAISSVQTLDRIWAFKYTHCRNVLLNSSLRPSLPGFVAQCVSVDKFHAFINLYHWQPNRRIAFIDDSFESCWKSQLENVVAMEASVQLNNVRVSLLAH